MENAPPADQGLDGAVTSSWREPAREVCEGKGIAIVDRRVGPFEEFELDLADPDALHSVPKGQRPEVEVVVV